MKTKRITKQRANSGKVNRRLLAILLSMIVCAGATAADRWTLIHAGWLLAVPGEPPATTRTVVIRNDRIVEIRAGYHAASAIDIDGLDANAAVIDLRDAYVLPGLIDAHVHLSVQNGGIAGDFTSWESMPDLVQLSSADTALRAAVYARRTLEAGFTTVRDLGASGDEDSAQALFALKRAVDAGHLAGPRMLLAGMPISATGGHGDIGALREDLRAAMLSPGLCDGVDSCRRAVRLQVHQGAGVIKLMASGGGREPTGGPNGPPEFEEEELRTIVETAHHLNVKVAAHAHGHRGIIAALAAGVDSIEHGSFANADAIQAFKRSGAILVPTLTVQSKRLAVAALQDPVQRQASEADIQGIRDTVANAFKSGVPIAFGTDAGMFPHGMNAREFKWYVDIGMSPMQAVASGTVTAARLLGMDDRIGTLEAGKLADIVAVYRDPLLDVQALEAVGFVMKNGTVYKSDRNAVSAWTDR